MDMIQPEAPPDGAAPSHASRRRLGATDVQTIPFVLGGNVFGWTADRSASFAILDAFAANGGTLIDTADSYSRWAPGHHGGESEEMLGAWLAASGARAKIQIATKVGAMPGEGGKGLAPSRIAAGCDASLRRLGIDCIDLYYAHCDDLDTPQEAVLEAFGKLIDAGKVRAIGASNFSVARLESARALAADGAGPRFDVVQPGYNLIRRDEYEGALQDFCVANHIGVVPHSGLASGFLTGKYQSLADTEARARGARLGSLFDARGLAVLAALKRISNETGASPAQISLAWLTAKPAVVGPIASATSVAQLEELMQSVELVLDGEHIALLDAAGRDPA
ncbi:aldo/keto reductase [Sphingopyxis panaciterrulae]|uniref:Aryl-alcohol dehydrogenase-like predicted oxidoreductase n=2 Tax=Sphingopyxis TaxID=165697 RepID=A0A7W9ERW7_9SPHN|nr:aldo/keto reductase [Sphingopyxis panaciterrulae]MBB5708133.1 aryl-alcohol dehydrogenase-like predicted oxidoreductase [Sphingopyxis panaciterrulae]